MKLEVFKPNKEQFLSMFLIKWAIASLVLAQLFLFSPAKIAAQDTASQTETPTQFFASDGITITEPLIVPNTPFTLKGTAEPGAKIFLTALRNDSVMFRRETTTNQQGEWSMELPGFPAPPTQFEIRSEVQLSFMKVVETVSVTTAAGISVLVLIQVIFERILRFLQVVGLLRRRVTRGFVFDVDTKKPIPFTLLTVESLKTAVKNLVYLQETVVSDELGFFKTIDLPPGSYKLTAAHPDFIFPVASSRPVFAQISEYYRGETVTLGKQKLLDILFIPLKSRGSDREKFNLRYWLNRPVILNILGQIAKRLYLPMAAVSLVMVIFYPGFINFVIFTLYLVMGVVSLVSIVGKPKLSGMVQDEKGQGIAQAVVRIYNATPYELRSTLLTGKDGRFSVRLPKGEYQIVTTKDGWASKTDMIGFETVKLASSKTDLSYEMSANQ